MRLSEFKTGIKKRAEILWANTVFTTQKETAYWVNNWSNMLSTFVYTLTAILFVDVVYRDVALVAGYTKNEMLLFLFVGQITYYISWIYRGNFEGLIESVNSGRLDLLLVKPAPSLLYASFMHIKIFSVMRDGLAPLIAVAFAINWSQINITPSNLTVGIFIIICGLIIVHIFLLLFSLPVFWLGQSSSILGFFDHFEQTVGKTVPMEAFPSNLRVLFSTIVPVLFSTGLSTSVILGKIDSISTLNLAIVISIVLLIVRIFAWKIALIHYSSASS